MDNIIDKGKSDFYNHCDYIDKMLDNWEENWQVTEESSACLSSYRSSGEKDEILCVLYHLGRLGVTRNGEKARQWVNENRKFRARITDALKAMDTKEIIGHSKEAPRLAKKIQDAKDYDEYRESAYELTDILDNRDEIEIILTGAKLASSDWLIESWLKTDGKELKKAISKFDKKVTPEVWGSIPLVERKGALCYLAPESRYILPWRSESLAFPDTEARSGELEKDYSEQIGDNLEDAEVISFQDRRDRIKKQSV